MESFTYWLRANGLRLLRWSLALVVAWIGALKFLDPTPVVGLLDASFSFLASPGFVFALGGFEVAVAILLVVGRGLRIVSLLLAAMFGGTLLIFLTTPSISFGEAGFPALSLAGEFLIKDVVLLMATLVIFAAQPIGATMEEGGQGRFGRAGLRPSIW